MFSDSYHKYRIFEYLTQKNHLLNLVNVYTYFKKKMYSPIKIVLHPIVSKNIFLLISCYFSYYS